MLGRTYALALLGLSGYLVEVEADVAQGLPAFTITGLPDVALGQARDRVRSACANSGHPIPLQRITVNLSPASLPKAGTSFDLAIAVAVLTAAQIIPAERVRPILHLGELGLDGRLCSVRGVLPAILAAAKAGCETVLVPAENCAEARLVPGVQVHAVQSLSDVVAFHLGLLPPEQDAGLWAVPAEPAATNPLDLAQVLGQFEARFSVEVAAAGAHHLFLSGPPGVGKTMLAARLPWLLPDLELDEALEVTAVHSLAGLLSSGTGLLRRPPFVNPHHTASSAALVGGGMGLARPGAVSLAHHGVLFLDEAPEFDLRALEALRQPLEHGELVLHRSGGETRYPAKFQLIMAANPCPCGRGGGKGLHCTCSPAARRRYTYRLSGPLLDRVDLQVQLLPVSRSALGLEQTPEPSSVIAGRIKQARSAQMARWSGSPWRLNGQAPGHVLRSAPWRCSAKVTKSLDESLERGSLTVRGYDRVLRTAWTLADLAGRDRPSSGDLDRALSLRLQAGSYR